MKLEDFFNLPEDEQAEIINTYKARKSIIQHKKYIDSEMEKARVELKNLQESCRHPLVKVTRSRDTNEYGDPFNSGITQYECPDCGKRWMETWED